jgi:misacylated tRNA(Ala) deacylase
MKKMHTAEHILNQTMIRLFGTERCFSAHINEKKSKCDYKFDRELSEDELKQLGESVNEIIKKDLPVTENFISQDEAKKRFNLKRLPEGTEGDLRIIKIGDYDACPCIGEHVKSTGEIGDIRIVSGRYNEGVLRIIYKTNSHLSSAGRATDL